MGLNRQLIRLVAGAATLVLGAVACHGASPSGTGYVPVGASSIVAPQANGAGAALPDRVSGDIDSTCGNRLHIVLLGIVDCKFKEKGYDGNFNIFNKTKGIVTISPSSGNSDTTFTILGAVIGRGAFFVRDKDRHHLILRVKVTL
jgi:hypothetical protein